MDHEWTQDEIDNEMFRYDDPDDCECIDAIIDALEGRGYCPNCGRAWWLTKDEIEAELRFQAEYAESVDADHERVTDYR